jgi:hypothetical protein
MGIQTITLAPSIYVMYIIQIEEAMMPSSPSVLGVQDQRNRCLAELSGDSH